MISATPVCLGDLMSRSHISLAAIAAILALLFILAPDVILVIFAGLLMAAFINGPGNRLAGWLNVQHGFGIAIFLVLLTAFFVVIGILAAAGIAEQFDELLAQLPKALESLRERVSDYAWAERALQRFSPESLVSDENRQMASNAVFSTFGAFGNAVIILFIGLYVAIDPALYRRGMVLLLAPSIRGRADDILRKCAATLKNWLGAQLIAMAVVGTLTAIGLFIIGVPLALILGVIAGLLAFIPNIGPIIAIIPGLLLALSGGLSMVLWVAAVYLAVQALESYVITPVIQQERVAIPPALTLGAQLLFGVLFGLLGLALAMPIVAVAMTLAREVYIHGYLEKKAPPTGGPLFSD